MAALDRRSYEMLTLLRASGELRRPILTHIVSRAGDAFNSVALPVLVFELTGSGRGIAGAVVFEVLPVLLLTPVGAWSS